MTQIYIYIANKKNLHRCVLDHTHKTIYILDFLNLVNEYKSKLLLPFCLFFFCIYCISLVTLFALLVTNYVRVSCSHVGLAQSLLSQNTVQSPPQERERKRELNTRPRATSHTRAEHSVAKWLINQIREEQSIFSLELALIIIDSSEKCKHISYR